MDFGTAFKAVQSGTSSAMRLPSWSGEVLIKVQMPDNSSKMTAPYLYVESRFGLVPWKETNIELFSYEWELIE